MASLGEVCAKPEYGWTTSASDIGSLKLLRTTDITKETLDWSRVPFCENNPPNLSRFKLSPGDIVISRAGSVGVSALIGQCPDAVFASYLIRFRPLTGLHAKYVSYFLHSPDYWHEISVSAAGIALQNVNAKKLAAIPIPIAPLPEQRKIVEEIEKQLTRLDAAVAALKRVQTNLKRYRAAVLKAACEGRLVPTEAELARREGRPYEPAPILLERILAERGGNKKSPVEPDMRDAPLLPEGWAYASMDQLTNQITSGSRDWSPHYDRGSSIFLMAQNVRPGKLDLSYRQLVDPPKDDPSRSRSQVQPQDLLVTIVGANTGDVCRVPLELPEHFVCQSVALMRPVLPKTSVFLDLYLNSQEHGVRQFKRYIYGAGRPHLRFDQLMMTCIVLPPSGEQERIVLEVERRLSLIAEIESQLDSNLKRADNLRQSILKSAFEGKLVPQDPNDEPASVLLERIRGTATLGCAPGFRATRNK